MCGIKIPQYEFALKMQGGLMCEGGRICGTLRYIEHKKSYKCKHQEGTSLCSTHTHTHTHTHSKPASNFLS